MRRHLAAAAILSVFAAVTAPTIALEQDSRSTGAIPQTDAVAAVVPDRPRDPWVFRCVLDGDPRTIVVALADDLWLAYDAIGCRLIKVWDGDVDFRGAVFDTTHGPQPVSRGETLLVAPNDPGWEWRPAPDRRSGSQKVETRFLGYRFEDGEVVLRWRVGRADDQHWYELEERPVALADDDTHRLQRSFRLVGGYVTAGDAVIGIPAMIAPDSDAEPTFIAIGANGPMPTVKDLPR